MEALGKVSPCWSSGSSLESPNIETHQNGRVGWRMDLNWEEHELQHFPVKQNDCYFFQFLFLLLFLQPTEHKSHQSPDTPAQSDVARAEHPFGTRSSARHSQLKLKNSKPDLWRVPLYHPGSFIPSQERKVAAFQM